MPMQPPLDDPDWDEDDDRPPSRSQLKREAEGLQDLGTRLIGLTRSQLSKIPLPEDLLSAIQTAQAITSRPAIKRQRQYIGKLMRQIESEPIRAALAELEHQQQNSGREHHQLEAWRDRLIQSEQLNADLAELVAEHPACDPQRLRQLATAARREAAQGQPPKSARLLFRYLRDSTTAP